MGGWVPDWQSEALAMLRNLMSFDNTNVVPSVFNGVSGFVGSSDVIQGPGRLGGNYFAIQGNGNQIWAYRIMSNSKATWTIGCAFQYQSSNMTGGDQTEILWVCDITSASGPTANTAIQFGLGLSTYYGLYVLDGAGVRHYSNGRIWRPLTWNYVEISATVGSSEAVTVKFNGNVVMALTGINTQKTGNAAANCICLAGLGGPNVLYDDVYINDGVAAAHGPANDSFLGDIAVLCSFPDAAGNYSQWTPTSGANYTCVDQFAYTDSTYVSSATASQIDTYKFPATAAVTIVGVQENVIARTDGGTHVLAPFYRNGGTDYEQTGSEGTPASTYAVVQAQFDYDPNSNSAWTSTILNAGEFGQELVS